MAEPVLEPKQKFNPDIEAVASMTGYTPDYVWRVLSTKYDNQIIHEAKCFLMKGKQTLIERGKKRFHRNNRVS